MLNPEQNNQRVGQKMVATYRGLKDFEEDRKKRHLDHIDNILDIDVAPLGIKPVKPVSNRNQALVNLSDLIDELDTQKPDGEYLAAKIRATQARILAQGKRVSPFLFDDYGWRTIGVKPGWIPKIKIKEQHRLVQDISREVGFEWNASGWQTFFQRARLEPREIQSAFDKSRTKILPKILETIERPDLLKDSGDYQVRCKSYPRANWTNWISGEPIKGFMIKVNTDTKVLHRWVEGTPEILAVHELGAHLLQAIACKWFIDHGLINCGYGVTSVPGPEQWSLEGSATVLPYLIPEIYPELSDAGKLALETRILERYVFNNTQNDLNIKSPRPVKDLIEEVQYYLPNFSATRLEFIFSTMVNDPERQPYNVAYQDGTRYFRWVADVLTPDQLKVLVKQLYSHPMTPKQYKEFVKDLRKPVEPSANILKVS